GPELVHADVLEADGVQHAGRRLSHPWHRQAPPWCQRHALGHEPPDPLEVDDPRELSSDVEAPRRRQHRGGEPQPVQVDLEGGRRRVVAAVRRRGRVEAVAGAGLLAHRGPASTGAGSRVAARSPPALSGTAPPIHRSHQTRAPLNTGPSMQARTFHQPNPSDAITGTTQVQQIPSPQAMSSSTATWHGMPWARDCSATARSIGLGPQAYTTWAPVRAIT